MVTEKQEDTQEKHALLRGTKEFDEDYRLFIEAGFSAVKKMNEASAQKLFRAAQVLRPGEPEWEMGYGYIALNKLEIKLASKYFEGVLKRHPDYHMAQVFLGLSYLFKPEMRKEGEKLIKEAMEKSDDPSLENLGKVSLEFAEKDLKEKSKAPFFNGTENKE